MWMPIRVWDTRGSEGGARADRARHGPLRERCAGLWLALAPRRRGRQALAALFVLTWGVLSFGTSGCLDDSVSSPSESLPLCSHDGTWVAFTRSRGEKDEIYISHDGAPATQVTESEHGVSPSGFDWSPDGSRIVFVPASTDVLDSGGVFVVNRDGSGLRRLTHGDDYGPCWAADGSTIVFRRGWSNLRAIDADGTGGRLLVRNADEPACSHTSPAIAFVVIRDGGWIGIDIGVLDLREGGRRVLPRPPNADGYEYASPAWSRDGRSLAFQILRQRLRSDPEFEDRGLFTAHWYLTELYVANADGTGLERLTANAVGDGLPTWLPDGRIAFESNRAGPTDPTNTGRVRSYAMNRDGSQVERLEWRPRYR